MRILVVEDDPSMQTIIKLVLEKEDHEINTEGTASDGMDVAISESFDMIILDLGLPDGNGFDVCRDLRDEGISTPILILSGEQGTEVKVKCLEAGADDYLTKPFDNSELIARISAIGRRSKKGKKTGEILRCGELEVDLINRSFAVNGADVELTNNEFNLLIYLLRNKNKIVSPEDISKNVWDIHFDKQTNYINVYISYLRKKIRVESENSYIQTVRNKGFIVRCDD